MKQIILHLFDLLSESWTWIIGIAIGLIGKISYEIYMKRTLTILQWIAVIGMSIVSGYVTSFYCMSNGWNAESQFLVPIATLLGEKFFIYIIENHRVLFDRIFGRIKAQPENKQNKTKQ